MSEIQAPQIVTIDILKGFKNLFLNTVKLQAESTNIINSIVQLNANNDINTGNTKALNVKDSAIFGTAHEADRRVNVFMAGKGNIAAANSQTIFGNFNKADANALFIIGNGTSETNRSNIVSITKDNIVNINSLFFSKTEDSINLQTDKDKIILASKLYYDPQVQLIPSTNNLNNFVYDVLNLDDNEIITANIAKCLAKALSNYITTDGALETPDAERVLNLETWQANLIKDLSFTGTPEEEDSKTISLTAAKNLKSRIEVLEQSTNINSVQEELTKLKKQISYLISCLTVDKISNASYKADEDELIEFYTVGIADYALDNNTKFKLADEILEEDV